MNIKNNFKLQLQKYKKNFWTKINLEVDRKLWELKEFGNRND